MKRLFPSTCFTVAALAAQVGAVGQLIIIGLHPTSRNNLVNNMLRDEPYVPQATRRLKLKRTLAEKLPKKGSAAWLSTRSRTTFGGPAASGRPGCPNRRPTASARR